MFAAGVAKGVTFFAASGDNSIDDGTQARTPDFPAASPNVWGVGGTNLTVNADGSRANEAAWGDGSPGDDGTGGGYDPTVAMPAWQNSVVPGTHRGVPDSSANADPPEWLSNQRQRELDGGRRHVCCFAAHRSNRACRQGVSEHHDGTSHAEGVRRASVGLFRHRDGLNGDPAAAGWSDSTGNGTPNGISFVQALC